MMRLSIMMKKLSVIAMFFVLSGCGGDADPKGSGFPLYDSSQCNFLNSCENNNQDSTSVNIENNSTNLSVSSKNPVFNGLVFSAATDVDKIYLSWKDALDDTTPSNSIDYEIYLSEEASFVPTQKNLYTVVTGKTEETITGLSTATNYNIIVVAVDQEGNKSPVNEPHSISTLSSPVVINANQEFHTDTELGLSGVTQNGDSYTYSNFSSSSLPNEESILFININDEMHLRRVKSVTTTNQGVTIQTESATLSDVLSEGTVSTQVTLYEDEETNNALRATTSNSLCSTQTNGEIEASLNFSFEPSFDFSVSWRRDAQANYEITDGHAIVRGEATIGIDFSLNGSGSVSCNVEKTLFSQKSLQYYVVAGVPVFQLTTLTVQGKADIKVSSELNANASANAIGKVGIGVEFNPNTKSWEKTTESPTLEFNLDTVDAFPKVEATATSTLQLIPELSVKFYALAGPKISINPSLTASLGVESAPPLARIGHLPVQMNTFNVDSGLDINIALTLGAFGKFIDVADIKVYGQTWKLLSLPTLSVGGASGKVNEPIDITATTEDGVHNSFAEDSIQWYVDPTASIHGDKTGTLTASKEDTYTAFFSGTGETTSAIRQFVWADVSVSEDEEPSPTPEPISGCRRNETLEAWCLGIKETNPDSFLQWNDYTQVGWGGCVQSCQIWTDIGWGDRSKADVAREAYEVCESSGGSVTADIGGIWECTSNLGEY